MTNNLRKQIISSIIFIYTFVVYLKALCPTIFVGDSGELITVAHILGIAHPTGYPLNTLLMKAISFLPLDNIAARCNLLSSVFFALTSLEIYLLFKDLGYRKISIVSGLVFFAFIPVFSKEATVARVYGLNAFLIIFLTRLALSKNILSTRKILIFSFFSGLAIGNHLQILFTIVFCGIILLFQNNKLGIQKLILSILLVLLGASVYLELPIRSHKDPGMDWENPENFINFKQSLFRSTFWYKSIGFSKELLKEELISFPKRLITNIGLIPSILCLMGIILFYIKHPPLLLILGGSTIINILLLLLHGSDYDLFQTDRYHIPFFLSIFISYVYIIITIQQLFFRRKSFYRATIIVILILNILYGLSFFSKFNRNQAFFADDLAFNLESLLPPDSCIFLTGDNITFSTAYRYYILHSRTDIQYIHRSVNLFNSNPLLAKLPIDNSPIRGKIEMNIIKKHPNRAFTTGHTNLKFMQGITIVPFRYIYKFVPQDWRFQKFSFLFQYFRNRPLSDELQQNSMVQKSCDYLYKSGGVHEREFNNLLEKAFSLREKILSGNFSEKDVTSLERLYLQSGLKLSAIHLHNYIKLMLKSTRPQN